MSRFSVMHTSLSWTVRFSLFFAVLALFLPVLVSAQGQEGISITPAIIEESLDPGFEKNYRIQIRNLKSTTQTFYVFTRNISGIDEGGVPEFAVGDERTGYEIADWITLSVQEVTIDGNTATSVGFSMDVPDDASPGSHFGGVFFSVEPPELQTSGAAVGYQVASILSIRVSGDIVEKASIRQFSTNKFLYGSQNVDFTVRIQNEGNVLVRPIGPLEVYNMLGNRVGNIVFNEERRAVFPNDERTYSNIEWAGESVGFGRYEAILSPVYGEDGAIQTMSSTVSFWVLPMNIILPALAVLSVIILITYVTVRIYIKRSLAHMNQGRRIVRRRRRRNSSATLLLFVVILTVVALFLIVLLALFA